MKTRAKFSLILILVLALVTVGTVAAQEGEDPEQADLPPACEEGVVSGTVVAVDEDAGVVIIDMGTDPGDADQCSVILGEVSADHPISALLGTFFSEVSTENLTAALETINVCVESTTEGETTTWHIVECEEGQEPNAQVIAVNEDGTITLSVEGETDPVTIAIDEETAESMQTALETLLVEWQVDEDGTLHQMGEEIDRLHQEEQLGFGVIVKFLSMVEDAQEACAEQEEPPAEGVDPCDVDLQFLVDEFKDGKGIGQLFQEMGKPDHLGIGHVRQEMKEDGGDGDSLDGPAATMRAQGKSSKPDVPPGQAKKDQQTSPQPANQDKSNNGKGNSGNSGNNGNGNGKGKP